MQRTQEGDEDFQCRVPSNQKLEIQLETNRCVSWFAFKWGELSWGGLGPQGLQGGAGAAELLPGGIQGWDLAQNPLKRLAGRGGTGWDVGKRG